MQLKVDEAKTVTSCLKCLYGDVSSWLRHGLAYYGVLICAFQPSDYGSRPMLSK